jgi:molybdate transport system substrate-binding protein
MMLRAIKLIAIVTLALIASASTRAQSSTHDVTVSAAISLKDALEEIQSLYKTSNPAISLHLNLAASGTLQRQIEQGAPVDVFISASPKEMGALESKGLIAASTRKDLLKNTIVLITPRDRQNIASFQDLITPSVKVIAIGEPQTVPAGSYAQQVLTFFNLYDRLKPRFVFAKDVRQVLTYVETGNADAGIVYATDARTSDRVKVVATAPEDSHSPVIYPVAALTNSKDVAGAKEFEDFLLGPRSAAIFKKYGFVPVE